MQEGYHCANAGRVAETHIRVRGAAKHSCALAEKVGPMNRFRLILWTVAMGYSGFLIAGRGTRSFDTNTIYEALIGALLGVLLAVLFTHRARRKHI